MNNLFNLKTTGLSIFLAIIINSSILSLAQASTANSIGQQTSMSSLYQLEIQRPPGAEPARFSDTMKSKVSAIRWILIDGIFGDFAENLYQQTTQVLQQEFGSTDIHLIRPSSFNTVLENSKQIANELRVLTRDLSKKTYVIAHSRGAAELFLALLQEPELLQKNITQVVLVQGAFAGSPLADFVMPGVDFLAEYSDLIRSLQDSAQSLTTLSSTLDRELLQLNAKKQQALFQKKIAFVRASANLSKISMPLKPSSIYLTQFFGTNDGVILTEQQWVRGWGQDLGTLESDHFGLLGGLDKGGISQRAFARTLMKRLFLLAP